MPGAHPPSPFFLLLQGDVALFCLLSKLKQQLLNDYFHQRAHFAFIFNLDEHYF